MRVLWMSINPALYRPELFGNWTTALETALLQYHGDEIQLAVAFEADRKEPFKVRQDGVDYYPIFCTLPRRRIAERWAVLRAGLLAAIGDFQPDIIHCFGSEWLFGAIARDVSVPVVIHMQGFLSVYIEMLAMAFPKAKPPWYSLRAAKARLRGLIQPPSGMSYNAFEREIMRANHYFMGRTEWDRNIVKYYSPGARYFYAA